MASASTISIAAKAKVVRMPVATASGEAVVRSVVAEASVNTAPMAAAPVMSPRLRDRFSRPETTPRWSERIPRHDGGVVGRLEQRIAGGDGDERCDVAGDAEACGRQGQHAGTRCHSHEAHDDHRPGPEAVHETACWHAGQGRDQRARRHGEADNGCLEPEPPREMEGADDQGRHHHRRDERAHGKGGTQHGVGEHRRAEQRHGHALLDPYEEGGSEQGCQQQGHVRDAEAAVPDRHGERVGRERQGQEQRAQPVEAGQVGFPSSVGRQAAMGQEVAPGGPAAG